ESDGSLAADENKVAGYIPDKAISEYDPNHNLYTGGHDNERAIQYALTNIVGGQDHDFLIVVLGDVDGSATPTSVSNYPLFMQSSAAEYNKALKDHGLSNEYRSFAVNYVKNGTTWPIYVRLYAPSPLTATEFGAERSQIPAPARPAPPPNTGGTTAPVVNNPSPQPQPKPQEDDGTWIAIVLGIVVLAALGVLAFLYIRPIQMEIEKEPVTLHRGEEAVIYGPDSKPDRKGVLLKKERYPSLPTGELATVKHMGMGKARVTGAGRCQVRNALGDRDEVIMRRGQEENVSLVCNNATYPVQVTLYKK
ncbi:MAG TPA: hypothetical protein VKU00_00090, partial [Chthonomonadaceae bacterium]|nr:hypothetical protein [Chthonomonadaceae bacterium]